MHTVGLHSALAIKRQRKRREELRKARERKYSSQSAESGAGASSSESLDRSRNIARRHQLKKPSVESNVVSPIGMLHVGIVFLVLGIFLIGSGLIPDDYTSWDQSISWWNELVCTGLGAIALGIFLITLNHYLAQHEEDELTAYVERQLTRSKSGRRLIKDEETGCLSTKKQKELKRQEEFMVIESEVPAHVPFSPTVRSPPSILISTPKSDLERILEEESERADEDAQEMQREIMANGKVHGDEIAMIGAMPAVAVRHERRRQGRRTKRPSLLFLQSLQSQSASPSPVQSPPGLYAPPPLEIYLIGKFSLLHVAVVTMLMGAVTLIVGLVQLKPGAEASEYRFVLIGTGMVVTLLGITVAVIRCCLLPLVAKRRERLVEQVLQEREAEKRRHHMDEIAAAPRMPRNVESEYNQHRTFVPNTHTASPISTITATKSPLTDPQFSPVIKAPLTSIP